MLKVFDGDGFLTRIAHPGTGREMEAAVRLGFIDAPELEQPGGREAKDFLNQLIGGHWVDLAILMKMDTGGIVDRHGRIVAVPYLRQESRGDQSSIFSRLFNGLTNPAPQWRNVELEMVLNGWAWVLDRYEPDQRYFDALEDAQQQRRGMWAWDNNVHPWTFKKQKYAARSRRVPRPPSTVDYPVGIKGAIRCQIDGCSGTLEQRSGRYGIFYGCSRFPECRYSRATAAMHPSGTPPLA